MSRRDDEEPWSRLTRRLHGINENLERLERRIWLALCGLAFLILANIAFSLPS